MQITVVGTGFIGGVLGRARASAGHDVTFGSRRPDSDDAAGTTSARVAPVADALASAEVVVLASRSRPNRAVAGGWPSSSWKTDPVSGTGALQGARPLVLTPLVAARMNCSGLTTALGGDGRRQRPRRHPEGCTLAIRESPRCGNASQE